MKQAYYNRIMTLAVAFITLAFNADAEIRNTVIAFLKETPKANVYDCTAADLMDLLTDESKEWIEGIECRNINILSGKAGVEMCASTENKESSYIKFNFKTSTVMCAIRCNPYLCLRGNSDVTLKMDMNGEGYGCTGNISEYANGLYENGTYNTILDYITGKATYKYSFNLEGDRIDPSSPLSSLTIEEPYQSDSPRIQFYGFKVFYDSIDTPTSVESIIDSGVKDSFEYFDLTGRRLLSVPEKGIYLRKSGNRVEKIIAK